MGRDHVNVSNKSGGLVRHCEDGGRSVAYITLCNNVGSVLAHYKADLESKQQKYAGFGDIQGTSDTIVAKLEEYARAGSRYVTFFMPDAEDISTIRLLGEQVLPRIAEL